MTKNRTSPVATKLSARLRNKSPLTVHYFETVRIELELNNLTSEPLFIESGTLKFEPDMGATPIYVDCTAGIKLYPNGSSNIEFVVRPTPIFRQFTSQFTARFRCHTESAGRLSDPFFERHEGFYIIVRPNDKQLGELFISFKQPEDQKLANILERYSERAGFVPRLYMRNPALGGDQWKDIETLIKRSHSAFIVWALRTDWGEGVEREVQLCRKHKVREVLLIEEGVHLPTMYKGTNRSYKRFDPSDPATALSEAVCSIHDQAVGLPSDSTKS